jgi:hypothetical protein
MWNLRKTLGGRSGTDRVRVNMARQAGAKTSFSNSGTEDTLRVMAPAERGLSKPTTPASLAGIRSTSAESNYRGAIRMRPVAKRAGHVGLNTQFRA